jgi:Flp pilus assembly protein TadD
MLAQAKAYHAAGHLREAERSYRTVLEADSGNVEALYLLAVVHHALGQPMDALASLKQAVRLKPDFAEAHNALGVVLKEANRVDEAVACYRTAI